ncbi:MAG: hypothetical protein NVSMB55_19620 [Mycobacteriales bacterium]
MPRSVLIVDDHAGFRSRTRQLLERYGFTVLGEAADGATAVTEVRRLQPDLVLLDVQLPDADGISLVSDLMQASIGLQVVLVSARDRDSYGDRLSATTAFLCKDELSGAALSNLVGPL